MSTNSFPTRGSGKKYRSSRIQQIKSERARYQNSGSEFHIRDDEIAITNREPDPAARTLA